MDSMSAEAAEGLQEPRNIQEAHLIKLNGKKL